MEVQRYALCGHNRINQETLFETEFGHEKATFDWYAMFRLFPLIFKSVNYTNLNGNTFFKKYMFES